MPVGLLSLRAGRTAAAQNPYVYDPDDFSDPGVYTYNINATAMSLGNTVTPNSLAQPHVIHPQCTVVQNTNFTSTNFKYFYPTANQNIFVAKSAYYSRDHSIQGFQPKGYFYVRMTAAGKGWYASIDSNANAGAGAAAMGIVTGFTEAGAGTYTSFWSSADLVGLGIGWTKLGTNLFDYRLRADGLSVVFELSINSGSSWLPFHTIGPDEAWLHMADGYPAIKSGDDPYGVRSLVISHDDTPTVYLSEDFTSTFYLDDFGVGNRSRTGAMTAGSNIITLDSANAGYFSVGDVIGVPTGYSAGAGARGTIDVGGAWPALRFANMAAANAHATSANFANQTITVTIASPAVVTDTAHGRSANDRVYFTTTGAFPTGMTVGVEYFVRNPTANNYQLSLTRDGPSFGTTGTQSGVHTRTNNFTKAYLVAEGYTYGYNSGFNQWFAPNTFGTNSAVRGGNWDIVKSTPLPWVGRITAIGGSGGTADRELTIGTIITGGYTSAVDIPAGTPIYFDNANVFNWFGVNAHDNLIPLNITLKLPDGIIPICQVMELSKAFRDGWWVEGRGSSIAYSHWQYPTATGHTQIWSPPGFPSASLSIKFANGGVRHLHIVGNVKFPNPGYGLNWALMPQNIDVGTETGAINLKKPFADIHNPTIVRAYNNVINTRSSDIWTKGASIEGNDTSNIIATYEDNDYPMPQYKQWSIAVNSAWEVNVIDPEADNVYLRASMEAFGDTKDTVMKRFIGHETYMASNSTKGTVTFEDIRVRLHNLYQDAGDATIGVTSYGAPSINSPLLTLNTSAFGSNMGGTLRGIIMDLGGQYIDTQGFYGDFQPKGITIEADSWNWNTSDCIFNMMPYTGTNTPDYGAVGFDEGGDTGPNTCTNVRVIGTAIGFGAEINGTNSYNAGVRNSLYSNNIADRVQPVGAPPVGFDGGGNVANSTYVEDSTPTAFVFTTQTGVAAGTLIHSNKVQVLGINMVPMRVWSVTANSGTNNAAMKWFGSYGDTVAYRYRDGSATKGNRWFPLKVNDEFQLACIAPASGQTLIVTFTLNSVPYTWSVTSA